MRTCLSLFVALTVAAGALSAQATTTNLFGITPDSTDATSRSGVPGASLGDVLIEVRGVSYELAVNANGNTGADFISVGDRGNTPAAGQGDGRVNGFQVTIQDQNASTTEPFDFCIVTEDARVNTSGIPIALGNPATPTAGNAFGPEVILRTTQLTTPAGAGIAAWVITATLATPADVIPNGLTAGTVGSANSTWYYGVGLTPAPTWTADGASIHMSSFDGLGSPFPNQGDNPRDGVVSMQQGRDVTNGAVTAKSTAARTQAIWILTEAPVLNHGAAIDLPAQIGPNPNFGVAGIYPDSCGGGNTGRVNAYGPAATPPGTYLGRNGVGDGYAVRIRAGADVGTGVFLGLGAGVVGGPGTVSGFSGAQIYLPFFDGAFVISFSSVFVPLGVIPASGELNLTLQVPSATLPLCLATPGRMSGQGAILNLAALKWTNGASASF